MDGVAFHDPMHEATKKPLTTVAACHCSPYSPGRQSRPHLFHVVRKVCTKSGHVSTIPSAVKNNSHHGISTIKSDYPQENLVLINPLLPEVLAWILLGFYSERFPTRDVKTIVQELVAANPLQISRPEVRYESPLPIPCH